MKKILGGIAVLALTSTLAFAQEGTTNNTGSEPNAAMEGAPTTAKKEEAKVAAHGKHHGAKKAHHAKKKKGGDDHEHAEGAAE